MDAVLCSALLLMAAAAANAEMLSRAFA